MRIFRKIIFFIISLSFLHSCQDGQTDMVEEDKVFIVNTEADLESAMEVLESDSLNIGLYKQVWRYQTSHGLSDDLIRSGKKAFRIGSLCGNKRLSATAAAYMAQLYLLERNNDSTSVWLQNALEYLENVGEEDIFLEAMVNNMAGIYSIQTDVNYSNALKYFKTGLSAVENTGYITEAGILLRNITHIYSIREDVSGIDYARKSYQLAMDNADTSSRYMAALVLSNMYLLNSETDMAYKYGRESLEFVEDTLCSKGYAAYAYYNYGDICAASGDDEEAEKYYEKALGYIPTEDSTIDIRTYTSYGNLCMRQNNLHKALSYYLKAEHLFDTGNFECQSPIMSGLSRIYDVLGDKEKALEYYKKYYEVSTKMINFRNENAFGDLQSRYEQSELERKLSQKEAEILRKDNNIIMAAGLISVISVVFLSLCFLYRKKNIMYRKIVQQNVSFRERLNENEKMKELKAMSRQQSMYKIYEELETLMKQKKIYRRKDLTVQMIAEMLGTNTTYMSVVINQFSGKNFPTYINSYRMEEVLAALGDTENEVPINTIFEQAGYASRTTYTRIFKSEIGCTPTKYREEARKIKAEKCADL